MVAMKCQHMADNVQCQQESTRDIRVVTSKRGWRIFLCDEHADRGIQSIRESLDRMALEPVEKERTER